MEYEVFFFSAVEQKYFLCSFFYCFVLLKCFYLFLTGGMAFKLTGEDVLGFT